MAFTPTITADDRATAQTNLLNGIDSRRGFGFGNDSWAELITDDAPFVQTLMAFKRKSVNDPDKKYFEHRPAWLDGRTFFSNAANAPACSATYAGKDFDAWNIQKTEDGGDAVPWFVAAANLKYVLQVVDAGNKSAFCNFLVGTVVSSTSINVIQLTDTPGFDVADNDKITIIGTAFAEGTLKTYAFSDKLSPKWASCQIFKNLAKASRTLMKTWVAGGNEWDRILGETAILQRVDMERAFILGGRAINTLAQGSANDPFGAPVATQLEGDDTNTIRTSMSIQQACRWADSVGIGGSRVFTNTEASYTYKDFVNDMEVLFEFGAQSRYCFGGRHVLTILTNMALDKDNGFTYENGVNEAGVKYRKFLTPHGDLNFVIHPLFRGDYNNKAFVVDMNLIDLLVFDDTFVETDVKTPGYDGIEHQFVSDMGIRVNTPEKSVAEFTWI